MSSSIANSSSQSSSIPNSSSRSSSHAGVVPHSSSTDEEFFQISACPNFSAKRGCWSVTVFFVQYNRHVYHSIKELHLWNLPCLPNCLDERYLALHHH